MLRRQWQLGIVAATTAAAATIHAWAPAGPHSWHWLHLFAQALYYLPILLAARTFGLLGAVGTVVTVSGLALLHVLRDWTGFPMVQAEALAQIATFWLVAVVSGVLFDRERRAHDETRRAHEETLTALASSLELRERYTAGHSRRVQAYSLRIARELGWEDAALRESVARGALLHDVGKIGIPDRILLKAGPLTEEERSVMRQHPELGAALVGEIHSLRGARALILAHHERFDGTGYPRGLAGRDIPPGARIFAVADTFDAMTTERPYQRAVPAEEAARTIAGGGGSQFDPEVVAAFLRVPRDEWARAAAATGLVLGRDVRVS